MVVPKHVVQGGYPRSQGGVTLGWNKWINDKDFPTPLMPRVFFNNDALRRSFPKEAELMRFEIVVHMDLQPTFCLKFPAC